MAELTDILKNEVVPRKSAIHDLSSSAAPLLLTPADGWVLYTNDGLNYNYTSAGPLFDTATGIITDTIVDSKIDVILTSTLNATVQVQYLEVKLEMNDPSNTLVSIHTLVPARQNIDHDMTIIWGAYNGPLAHQYGFSIYTRVIGGDITISNRSSLIRV